MKRKTLNQAADRLKSELKIHKEIYRAFMDEYEKYDGLNDVESTDLWRGKQPDDHGSQNAA